MDEIPEPTADAALLAAASPTGADLIDLPQYCPPLCTSSDTAPVIDVDDVSFGYDSARADQVIHGVSFTAHHN